MGDEKPQSFGAGVLGEFWRLVFIFIQYLFKSPEFFFP